MKKKEVRTQLGMNNTELAAFLDISEKHLRNLKELSKTHIRLIEGEITKRRLELALEDNARLTSKCLELQEQIDNIVRALDV